MKVETSAETNSPNLLPQRFVAMCVEEWSKHNLPRNLIAPVMLAQAINLLLEDSEPDEVGYVLAGLAKEILSSRTGVGHA
ncbi:hypothetical protein NB311A_07363 [Nitrobacter sp. Nb-311A]|uniref:hypothetical protein n=1 Tax=Nitrobacter sp. Nb-311A TaxID=314253 RepID=UPI0000684C1C|nr:hypothetical protein [Nitrobacter sp. Nb-311A]EAQ36949.1 hypothetical protein NB311A_07363 [Nitrobacter sp. Nb-311A]